MTLRHQYKLHKKFSLAILFYTVTVTGFAQNVSDKTNVEKNGSNKAEEALKTEEINITAPKIIEDLGVTKDKATVNVQSATAKDIAEKKNTNLGEFINESMQSVNVNEFSGNGFQMDVNFRGFTASPLLGTPQGLSVYLDGVRINEPFGDVVNWDLIPMIAISKMDLVPGSNPVYGLNTLGGAIALRTKNGFDDAGVTMTSLGGSWGRQNYQVATGGHKGSLAGFLALNYFDEDGWRDFAPSNVKQAFGRIDFRNDKAEFGLSALWGDTNIIGNGLTPRRMLDDRWESVLTSPDGTTNKMHQFNATGKYWVTDNSDISGNVYYRKSKRTTLNGDINDTPSYTNTFFNAFNDSAILSGDCATSLADAGTGTNSTSNAKLVCQNADAVGGVAPTGFINGSSTDQTGSGFAIKYDWSNEKHSVTLGADYTQSNMHYIQTQQWAYLDDQRRVIARPVSGTDDFYPNGSSKAWLVNDLTGVSQSKAVYLSETWTPNQAWTINSSLRASSARVKTDMLHYPVLFTRAQDINANANNPNAAIYSGENLVFNKILPAIGFSWQAYPSLTLYGNYSQGMRAPTPIELGCAKHPDSGKPKPAGVSASDWLAYQRRIELDCSVQTILTNDPPLKAVKSQSYEVGTRGLLFNGRWQWNAGLFRTDLYDDILFDLDSTSFHTHFVNVDQTRREGIELGLSGSYGKWHINTSATFMEATFQSSFKSGNEANSSVTCVNSNCQFTTKPGDRMPNFPDQIFKINASYQVSEKFKLGLTANGQSSIFLRGNENNLSEALVKSGDPLRLGNLTYEDKGTAPGFIVFNLQTNYQLNKEWEIFLKLNNVLDKKYYTAGQLRRNPISPSIGTGYVDTNGWNYNSNEWTNVANLAPGAPRALWVGATYSFGGNEASVKDND